MYALATPFPVLEDTSGDCTRQTRMIPVFAKKDSATKCHRNCLIRLERKINDFAISRGRVPALGS